MKHKLEITDIDALEAAYPQCVTKVMVEKKKANYPNIRAAMKLYGSVPGVKLANESKDDDVPGAAAAQDTTAANTEAVPEGEVDLPEFIVRNQKTVRV